MKIEYKWSAEKSRRPKGCIICHATCQELDASWRCGSCAAAKKASEYGTTYGKFIAANRRPEPYRGITENKPEPSAVGLIRMQHPVTRKCVICGQEFTRDRNRSLCCSRECMKIHRYRAEKQKERAEA